MSSCHKSEIFICSIQNSILTLLLLTVGVSPKVQAQSIIPAQDGTATVVKQNGQQFNITGGTISGDNTNLFHSFQQFNLNAGQIANFLVSPNIKNILGRVVGQDASVINGLIKLTGGNANLFLLNPAGIVFGPNAQLNVPGSFTATTATGIGFGNNWFQAIGSNNYTALIGEPNQFSFNINQPGSIINQGSLQVGIGQNLNLIGGNVINTGNLTAPEGNITITAVPGSSLVKVSQIGHLLNLEITPQQGNTFTNITPLTLPQLLTGGSLNPATGITVDPTGQISLTSLGTTIPNSGDVAVVSGNLNVSGQTGGAVNVLGNSVNLIDAKINASGISGGGQVLIGGGLHGEGTVPNAESTFVDQNTLIDANALTSGNGGQVIVWSDGVTEFNGNINALGGSQSGNGGFVETSGKNLLTIGDDAKVNTFAPQGKLGTWLLDPNNLTVVDTNANNSSTDNTSNNLTTITATTNDSTIEALSIVNALCLDNVELIASNSITVNAAIDASANTQAGNLTLSTPTINLYAPITLYTGSMLSGNATTVNVGINGSIQGSIQNAIDVAATGATVNLAAGIYTPSKQIDINKSLSLIGAGENSTTISGSSTNRVLEIDATSSVVNLNDLSISNGYSNDVGAGILLAIGTLNFSNGILSHNSSLSDGGAIYTSNGTNLNLNNVTISNNSATGNGGGIYNAGNTTVVNSSTLSANSAANGGGIYNNAVGTLTINDSSLFGNQATTIGGSIYNAGTANITSSSIDNFTDIGGTVTFNGDISATQVDTDKNSIVNISGNINTTGAQIYDGAVTIANNPTLTASIIGFQSNVDGNSNLTINTSQGVNFLGAVNVASLTTGVNGSTKIQADITTSGALTYNNPVTIANNPDLTANSVTFASTVNGNSNLTINIQNGNVNFQNAVGNNVGLGDLTIENASNFVGESIDANSITETAGTGNTTLGNLTTQGGGVNLTTKGNISTGNIATNGSDITLNGESITTGTLNTSSTNQSGDVDITALGSYRGVGTFIDSNGILSSISTAGKTSSGNITIHYGGHSPFIIGDSTVQGTAGAITSSANNIIAPDKTILDTYYQGNISLIPSYPILSLPTFNFPTFNLPTITLPFKGTQLQLSYDNFSQLPVIAENDFIRRAITNTLAQEKIGMAVPLIEEFFNEQYTEYYGSDIRVQPQTITEIETTLERIAHETGKRTAVTYIISHPDSLELIAVLPHDKMVHKTVKEGDRQTLLQIVQEFRKRIASPLLRNDYKAPAEKLYQLLISPIEPTLKAEKIDNLLFATDSGLRLIPFAALYDGHQFLVEKYSLGIIPSFSLVDSHYNSLQKAHVLAMGASNFTGMNSLPSVKVELPTVVQLLGQKRFFINDAFTIENLLVQHELNPTQIIHLATHATFSAGVPHNSYIQFWGQEKLRLDNLKPLDFHNPPVELLVLSACRTALGDEKVELGFTGLAVRAGVKSALGSLWSVSDQGTLALMTEVYSQLRKVSIKAEALRQAQIAMITGNFSSRQANQSDTSSQIGTLKKENLSHPYYWAAFVLVGSPW